MDYDKRSILELKNMLVIINCDKILNNNKCIICFEAPRVIRNKCGHGIACYDCNNKLQLNNNSFKCPICNKIIKEYHISNCLNTYNSNTL